MSYSFIQTPATQSLAQSPMIFSVSSSQFVGQTNFQYIGLLSIWDSTQTSASAEVWTLAKYPSSQGKTGIFDVSRIVNSTQTWLAEAEPTKLTNYKFESFYRYQSGSSYVTGSHIYYPQSGSNFGELFAVDGYQVFPEPIGESLNNLSPYYPFLYDGPTTQSVFIDNIGKGYLWSGFGQVGITELKYTNQNGVTASYAISGEGILEFPLAPAQSGFPLSTSGLTSFSIQSYSGANPNGLPLNYTIGCQQKYPNIRIKFKNRFGVLQYINMDMINRKSFTSEKRTYQPQLGSWQDTTLSYNEYDSQTLNYIVDSKQNIICNTNWLDESWNDILKQLLVSNEIYWCQENTTEVKPLTIVTSNVQFKTGVVDHLIQYTFEFQYGQNYKLII
jgi:hypothetical protein